MKKIYVSPALDINVIEMTNIIATSPVKVTIGSAFAEGEKATADAKEFDFDDEEDDEW